MALAVFNGAYIGTRNTGIGVVSRELSKEFSKENILFLDPFSSGSDGNISIPSNLSPDYGLKAHLRRLYWIEKKIPRIIKQESVEFFLSPLPEAPLLSNVRSAVLVHDLLPLRFPEVSPLLAYHFFYVRLVISKAELVFCNSNATAMELHEFFKVPVSKLIPIKLGFDRKKFFPVYEKRENFFLVLGRHNPHKNLKRVIQAFSLVKDQTFKLYFVGPFDKRYTPRLIKYSEELGVSKNCIWKNWVTEDEKIRLLNTCKSLLILSLWEGFGLPALEAMACRTPVIASNRGALPEVVGNDGLLVDPINIEGITEAMEYVIGGGRSLHEIAEKGVLRSSQFDWRLTAKEIESVLQSVC
tara:strand:- start:5598 stop:6662 length:1065 start_codon:yes stop_codon:yes gene_type:complete